MEQLSLGLYAPPPALPHASPERRIDITLARLADIHDALSEEERTQLHGKPWWSAIITVSRVRAMERAEEEGLARPSVGLADDYDRLVQPGEHAGEAIIRVFKEVCGTQKAL